MVNPLNKYFRQPVIYMELPSQGRWWRPGSINMPADRRIPVCPMTARDEILLRTPDALLNGITVKEVIESCCNVITDAWAVPNIDVDALLIGIRIASYGNMLDVDSTCPHCGTSNRHGVDLGDRLGKIRSPDFDFTLQHDQLLFRFKPMQYFAVNREDSLRYHEDRLLKVVNDSNLSEEDKIKEMTNHARKMLDSSMKALALQTEFIQLQDGTKVNEYEYIIEFYNNTEGDVIKKVQAHLIEMYNRVKVPDIRAVCEECQKNYEYPIEFDFSSFFGRGF